MKKTLFILTGLAAAIGLAVIAVPTGAQGTPHEHAAVCGPAGQGTVRCHAQVMVDENGHPAATVLPAGFGPAQFRGAYSLSGVAGTRQVIGIVDAYDDPSIAADLAKYSSTFGLPSLPTCNGPVASSPVPCFQKVDQNGGTVYPRADAGWALEISLDVEAAHAVCQNCSILLVETTSNSLDNLAAGVDRAATLGANEISNSYGGNEFNGESAYDVHYNHPGVAVTVSSGDNGYGTEYPAASSFVTAVGGTTLAVNADNSYKSEKVWSGSGSGCSSESKSIWQTDGCANRTIADVAADADPNSGAAVYDSVRYQGRKGWFQVGGTSLSSPLIAGVYALAGGVTTVTNASSLPYTNGTASNLHDVTTGSNGTCGTYLCSGAVGFDGPTGLGSPHGTSAF